MKLYAYNTKYEIHDYDLGDIPRLENDMSVWDQNSYFPGTGHYDPKYYYDEENRILYVPRGYDKMKLEALVGKPAVNKRVCTNKDKVSYSITVPPKNDAQKESVRFLTGMKEYRKMGKEHQLILSLPTGAGKTYCAISACSILETRVMVVVGTDNLRKQWARQILQFTNLSESSIYMINGTKSIEKLYNMNRRQFEEYAFFITTHSSLRSYVRTNGFGSLDSLFDKLGIGVKIIDEAHLQYLNTMFVDYSTNVWKTFYLTATFSQSTENVDEMFQKAFKNVFRLKLQNTNRKHVIWWRVKFSSKSNAVDKLFIKGTRGFNKFNYIEYEMSKDALKRVFEELMKFFIGRMKLEGKILVLSAKKESCEYFKSVLNDLYPDYSACCHYTFNKVDDFAPYGVIFATSSMLGTGEDIAGLRLIVNLEPMSSKRNTVQIVGRLREYSADKDTYYVEPIDVSFPIVTRMLPKRESVLKDIVKEAVDVKL